MTDISRLLGLASMCFGILAFPAASQELPNPPLIHWGLSGGLNHYQEKGLMQLQGPEFGAHAKLHDWSVLPSVQFEGDVLLGTQKYSSAGSGSMSGVTNLETRWRAMAPVFSEASTDQRLFAGLAIHTLWNDLRGTTTFQQKSYGGYERSSAQLWLPMRWSSADMWDLDVGLLIYGQHTSKLSQVSTSYANIVNTQRSGQYIQASFNLPMGNGDSLKPFIRYTHLGDSNSVVMNANFWVEPQSHRWQVGAIWEFDAR